MGADLVPGGFTPLIVTSHLADAGRTTETSGRPTVSHALPAGHAHFFATGLTGATRPGDG